MFQRYKGLWHLLGTFTLVALSDFNALIIVQYFIILSYIDRCKLVPSRINNMFQRSKVFVTSVGQVYSGCPPGVYYVED